MRLCGAGVADPGHGHIADMDEGEKNDAGSAEAQAAADRLPGEMRAAIAAVRSRATRMHEPPLPAEGESELPGEAADTGP